MKNLRQQRIQFILFIILTAAGIVSARVAIPYFLNYNPYDFSVEGSLVRHILYKLTLRPLYVFCAAYGLTYLLKIKANIKHKNILLVICLLAVVFYIANAVAYVIVNTHPELVMPGWSVLNSPLAVNYAISNVNVYAVLFGFTIGSVINSK